MEELYTVHLHLMTEQYTLETLERIKTVLSGQKAVLLDDIQ